MKKALKAVWSALVWGWGRTDSFFRSPTASALVVAIPTWVVGWTAVETLNRADRREVETKKDNQQLMANFQEIVKIENEASKDRTQIANGFRDMIDKINEESSRRNDVMSHSVAVLDLLAAEAERSPQSPYLGKVEIMKLYQEERQQRKQAGRALLPPMNEDQLKYVLYDLQAQGMVILVNPGRKYGIPFAPVGPRTTSVEPLATGR